MENMATHRKKTPRLIITFPTTTAAMAMEDACGSGKGRLIPIPGEIRAGCGLAWCASPAMEAELTQWMAKHNIHFEQKRIMDLY